MVMDGPQNWHAAEALSGSIGHKIPIDEMLALKQNPLSPGPGPRRIKSAAFPLAPVMA
jgi:hypothetical protein